MERPPLCKRDQIEKEIQEEARLAAIQIKKLKENPLTIFPADWKGLKTPLPVMGEPRHAVALIAIDALQKCYMSIDMALLHISNEAESDEEYDLLDENDTNVALIYYSNFTKSTLRWLWWAIYEQDYRQEEP